MWFYFIFIFNYNLILFIVMFRFHLVSFFFPSFFGVAEGFFGRHHKAMMNNEEEKRCPLCAEEMDWTDQQFMPCKCGYQVTLPIFLALFAVGYLTKLHVHHYIRFFCFLFLEVMWLILTNEM